MPCCTMRLTSPHDRGSPKIAYCWGPVISVLFVSPWCQWKATQHTDMGLVLCTGVNWISFHYLKASHKKQKREGECFQHERWEPPECSHTVSHNPTYPMRGGLPWVRYPQSTRSLDGQGSQPRAALHKVVPLPHGADTRKEEYLRIRNDERSGAVGEGKSITIVCS